MGQLERHALGELASSQSSKPSRWEHLHIARPRGFTAFLSDLASDAPIQPVAPRRAIASGETVKPGTCTSCGRSDREDLSLT
jgi:hypothetical protein